MLTLPYTKANSKIWAQKAPFTLVNELVFSSRSRIPLSPSVHLSRAIFKTARGTLLDENIHVVQQSPGLRISKPQMVLTAFLKKPDFNSRQVSKILFCISRHEPNAITQVSDHVFRIVHHTTIIRAFPSLEWEYLRQEKYVKKSKILRQPILESRRSSPLNSLPNSHPCFDPSFTTRLSYFSASAAPAIAQTDG